MIDKAGNIRWFKIGVSIGIIRRWKSLDFSGHIATMGSQVFIIQIFKSLSRISERLCYFPRIEDSKRMTGLESGRRLAGSARRFEDAFGTATG